MARVNDLRGLQENLRLEAAAALYYATRLVAYRQGAGDAPELLAEGLPDELTVGIPSSYVFNPGESYDLWLAGKNARGTGPKGPVVVWVP